MAELRLFHELDHDQVVTLMAQGWSMIEDQVGQWLCDGKRWEALHDKMISELVNRDYICRDDSCSSAKNNTWIYRLTPRGLKRAAIYTDVTYYRLVMMPEDQASSESAALAAKGILFLLIVALVAWAMACFLDGFRP